MTCIVAMRDPENNCVVLGADSEISNDTEKLTSRTPKIFQVGKLCFGIYGTGRLYTLLRYRISNDFAEWDNEFMLACPEEFMQDILLPEIERVFSEAGFTVGSGEDESSMANSGFVVAFGPHVFFVDHLLQVDEPADPFIALGCGALPALGSLHASTYCEPGTALMPVIEHVALALEASAKYSLGVSAPFAYLATDSLVDMSNIGEDGPDGLI